MRRPDPAQELLDQRLAVLRANLADLDDARENLLLAHEHLSQVRDAVERILPGIGNAYLAAEQPVPIPLIRELYWDNPELRAEEIAHAFGMRHGGEVSRMVGSEARELPCRGRCGATVTYRATSRADRVKRQGWRWQDRRFCEKCQRLAYEQHREDEERRMAQWAAESRLAESELQLLDEARSNGVLPRRVYVEYPGVPGTWLADESEVQSIADQMRHRVDSQDSFPDYDLTAGSEDNADS